MLQRNKHYFDYFTDIEDEPTKGHTILESILNAQTFQITWQNESVIFSMQAVNMI